MNDALAWVWGSRPKKSIKSTSFTPVSSMHRAIDRLAVRPEALIIDVTLRPYLPVSPVATDGRANGLSNARRPRRAALSLHCQGRRQNQSIAAASILAKTFRDDYMDRWPSNIPCTIGNRTRAIPPAATGGHQNLRNQPISSQIIPTVEDEMPNWILMEQETARFQKWFDLYTGHDRRRQHTAKDLAAVSARRAQPVLCLAHF